MILSKCTHILIIIINLNFLKLLSSHKTYWDVNSPKCQKTWRLMESVLNITTNVNHYELLEICDKSTSTCCNNYIEKKLNPISLVVYQKSDFLKSILKIKLNFIKHASNFDSIVKEIIDNYELEFHLIANKTQGSHQNLDSNIFDLFFDKIKKYYGDYPIEINNVLPSLFFNISLTLMDFKNDKNHRFDLNCIAENINDLNLYDIKQLNSIEDKLINSIESLKLFTNGLTKARDMMIDFYTKFENPIQNECKKQIIKMNGCQSCLGDSYILKKNLTEWKNILIKPCYEFCLNSLKTCLFFDEKTLDPVWKLFLEQMSKLANIIDKVASLENVMNNLKFKLNNLISNFRINNNSIIRNIFAKCGSGFTTVEKIQHKNRVIKYSFKKQIQKRDHFTNKLSLILLETNNYFKDINQYWLKLMDTSCKKISSYDEKCWNGSHLALNRPLISTRITKLVNETNDLSFMRHLESLKYFNKRVLQHLDETSTLNKFQQSDSKIKNRNNLLDKLDDKLEDYYDTDEDGDVDGEEYYDEDENNNNQNYGHELVEENYDENEEDDYDSNSNKDNTSNNNSSDQDDDEYNIKDDYDYAFNYDEYTSTTTTNKNKLMRVPPTKLKLEKNMIKSSNLNEMKTSDVRKNSFINSYLSLFSSNLSSSTSSIFSFTAKIIISYFNLSFLFIDFLLISSFFV